MKPITYLVIAIIAMAILAPAAYASGGGSIVHHMMVLVIQLAIVLFAAKLLGTFFERVLKQPSVLGELAAGMIIGPYALGSLVLGPTLDIPVIGTIQTPEIGPLFPLPESGVLHFIGPLTVDLPLIGTVHIAKIGPVALGANAAELPGVGPLTAHLPLIGNVHISAIEPILLHSNPVKFPISPELYGVATVASIVLLFMIGLETDFKKFFRFFLPGSIVGVGGVVGSFFLGDFLTVLFSEALFGVSIGFMDPRALFMGTISTATSVGITARVLSDQKKLDSAEGTTILAGAVVDDVLGIIILAIVVGIDTALDAGEEMNWATVGVTAAKAFGFWIGATTICMLLARKIARFLKYVPSEGSRVALGLGLALLLGGLAESAGLAMIIGAYIMGLSLSKEAVSHELERDMEAIYYFLVPVFFAVMGMLVDFSKMGAALTFGLVYTGVAIVGKVLGGGLPVLGVGFNLRGAWRVGIGMLPRGEVALIVAGVGLASGTIDEGLFGVAILMTVVTTVIAPPILVHSFKKPASGLRKEEVPVLPPLEKLFTVAGLDHATRELVLSGMRAAFEKEGYTVNLVAPKPQIYQITKEKTVVEMDADEAAVYIHTQPRHHGEIQPIVNAALEDCRKRVGAIEVKTVRFETGRWEKE